VPQETSSLVRAIGRWSLAALMLNTIIGASILGLPSLLAAHLGGFSLQRSESSQLRHVCRKSPHNFRCPVARISTPEFASDHL